jgi:hypothetical protein
VLLDDFEFGFGEFARLVQNLMGDLHLPDVVQVGAQPQGGESVLRQPERTAHCLRILRDPAAVAEGVAVRRFDRLTPVLHHRQEGSLELFDLGLDVHQVQRGVEPSEQAIGCVEQPECILISPLSLIEPGQLARGLASLRIEPVLTARSIALRSRDSASCMRPVSR